MEENNEQTVPLEAEKKSQPKMKIVVGGLFGLGILLVLGLVFSRFQTAQKEEVAKPQFKQQGSKSGKKSPLLPSAVLENSTVSPRFEEPRSDQTGTPIPTVTVALTPTYMPVYTPQPTAVVDNVAPVFGIMNGFVADGDRGKYCIWFTYQDNLTADINSVRFRRNVDNQGWTDWQTGRDAYYPCFDNLSASEHTVEGQAKDLAGNESNTVSRTFSTYRLGSLEQ